ncbi:DUF4573 domain-containing protein [Lentzea xinjiangensis]|nr:DUF4573 domain-containing protein [Lentzea xinjiangensis]
MNITEENKLKGSLFIEAYGSLIDGISKDAESETEKALDITFNAIGAASATVMLAIDPLGSIIGAGVGWLIEHVSFLRDALNQVMGNPEEIQANVEANKARAVELRTLAEDHKNGLATFDGWTGTSSERFKTSMDAMYQELNDLASAVETKAKIVAIMGMLVTVLRDIVRDLISQLIGSLIGGALLAAAAMIPTFGASIPIFCGFAVGKAVALGTNIASRVARVVAALGRQMKRIGDVDDIMAKISKGWQRFEGGADVAEIGYEGYKAQDKVDKAVDGAASGSAPGGASTQDGTATAALRTGSGSTVQAESTATLPNAPRMATASSEQLQPMQMAMRTGAGETTEPTRARLASSPLEPMQATMRTGTSETAEPMRARLASSPLEPMQATMRTGTSETAEPMQALRMMNAAEPVQAFQRTEAVQPMQAFQRAEAVPAEPVQAFQRTEAVQPMQAFQRVEAVPAEPVQAFQRTEAVQPMQAFQRVEAVPAEPVQAFQRVEAASDSTMVSGVSMTAGAPVGDVQPMQAREMYYSDSTPAAEPLQPMSAGYEPMARTQMSHAYEALEPTQPREYSRLEAQQVYESVNPLTASEQLQPTTAYESGGQAAGGAAQPLRQAVSSERPARPTE